MVTELSEKLITPRGVSVSHRKAEKYTEDNQYLRHLGGVSRVVHSSQSSHLGNHLLNKNGIGHFRKQF